ncbi:MAG: DUF4363 family protein [Oscillospiraceae bacterium]
MKKFLLSLVVLLLILIGISYHAYAVIHLSDEISELSATVDKYYRVEDWENVISTLNLLQERWDKSRLWASLTIETTKIEEIDISLKQAREYAHVHAKEDFIGEFIMFQMLVEHLPHQEGFGVEELL